MSHRAEAATVERVAGRLYEAINDDAEERACDDLPGDACRVVPGNVLWNVTSGAFTKLGEQLANPGTVLPWVLGAVGAPAAFIGMLVPVKDAGSLLPQLAVAGRIRTAPRRAPWWVWSAAAQVVALTLMALAVASLSGVVAGLVVVAALAAFSVASGVGSVAFKDVMAKTVPKGERGRVLALRATIGGLLGVAAGLFVRGSVDAAEARWPYVLILGTAALAFAVGAAAFARVRESDGHTAGGRDALAEARAGVRFLREQSAFRAFVVARALLLALPLAVPFITLFGQNNVDPSLGSLGVFMIANALAATVSSPFWGRFADLSSHRTMAIAGALGALAIVYALAIGNAPDAWRSALSYAPAFVLAGVAHGGVRLGRKTYLVDGPPARERPTYVAIANTSIGAATVAGAAVGTMAGWLGSGGILVVFGACIALGAVHAWRLPPASEMVVDDEP